MKNVMYEELFCGRKISGLSAHVTDLPHPLRGLLFGELSMHTDF